MTTYHYDSRQWDPGIPTQNIGNIESLSSAATLYAVVNTSAVGQASVVLDGGNITHLESLSTIYAIVNTSAQGQASVVIDGGILTHLQSLSTIYAVVNTSAQGQASVVLDAGTDFIGLVSTASIHGVVSVTGTVATNANITDDAGFNIGINAVDMAGFLHDDSAPDSVDEGDAGAARMSANRNVYTQIRDGAGNERGANVNASNSLEVSVENTPGVTNSGTTKTLVSEVIATYNSGNYTVFVPSNKFHITSLIISADESQRIAIRSGVTYLVGNSTIGISLATQGGFVETGSVDSPIYIGSTAGDAFIIESSATGSIGGKVIYFDE